MTKSYIAGSAKLHESVIFEHPVRVYAGVLLKKGCRIGRFSYVNIRCTLNAGTQIGRYCSIGKNADLGAVEHPLERLSTSPVSYNFGMHFPDFAECLPQVGLRRPKVTKIGHDVWIGSNVTVRRGVTIGHGAVIAGGAFVHQDVAPYQIVGGLPAKLIRMRFDPDIVAALLDLKWWDLPLEDLATVPFDDIHAAVARLTAIRASQAGGQGKPALKPVPAAPAPKPRGSGPSGAGDKAAKLRALQALMDGVPASPARDATAEEDAFAELARGKLLDRNMPATLLDLIGDQAARLHARYDLEDPRQLEILNTRLAHVADLVDGLDADGQQDLPKEARDTILSILRSPA